MESIQDLLLYGSAIPAAYFAALVTGSIIENFGSQRIRSEEELEAVVKEEAEKLGVDNTNLISNWIGKDNSQYSKILGARSAILGYDTQADEIVPAKCVDGEKVREIKVIDVKEGWGANRGAVRHELYHLKRHLPLSKNKLVGGLKWIYQEPAAVLYAVTGLKV